MLILILSGCSTACAGISPRPVRFTHLSTQNGLSQSTVHAIHQDRTGYVWFATMSGIDRYDGYTVTHFDGPDLPDRRGPVGPAYAICEWKGRLWVGWDADGMTWFDEEAGTFRRPDVRQRANSVTTLFPDGDSVLWVGTGQGLFLMSDRDGTPSNAMLRAAIGGRLNEHYISGICRDLKKRMWIATVGGLFCWDPADDSLRSFGTTGLLGKKVSSPLVRTIFLDANGRLWIGTNKGLDCYSENAGIEQVLSGSDIAAIAPTRSGDLWLGTFADGVIVLDPVTRKVRQRILPDARDDTRLPSGKIRSVAADKFNGIWVGTSDAGAHRSSEGGLSSDFHEITPALTGPNAVWSFLAPPASSNAPLYIGAQNGVFACGPDMRPHMAWPARYAVRAMLEGRGVEGDGLWVGTLGGGLRFLRRTSSGLKETARYFQNPRTNNESGIYALHRDRAGSIWIGSNGGGLRSLAGAPMQERVYPLIDGRDTARWVLSICEDRSGTLWTGTWKQGLWRRAANEERFKKVRPEDVRLKTLMSQSVFSMQPDRNHPDVLWLGTNGDGLWRYDTHTGEVTTFGEKEGLPDDTIYGIIQDTGGLVWVSTNRGIAICDPVRGDILHPPAGERAPGKEFNLGAVSRGRDGSVLFGAAGGFVECGHLPDVLNTPPVVVLAGLTIAGRETRAVAHSDAGPTISVAHDAWPLALTFTALHLDAPRLNLYTFAIEGIDTNWSAPSTNRRLDVLFLPPGTYTVRARVCTPEGIWSVKPLAITLVVAPAFWNTWTFRVLLFVTVIASLVALWILGQRRAHARDIALHKEQARLRRRIATDFHDDFGARAARISMTAHLLNDGTEAIGKGLAEHLDRLALDAQKLSREMREMTWELDPERDSLLDLAAYLKGYSDELFDATPIAFSLEGISQDLDRVILPMEWRQQIGRIFKEGMTNALKHAAGCHRVWLGFAVDRGVLQIELRDDGSGFGVVGVRRGNGLKNMRERARSLHGELAIDSCPGGGTTIRLRVKLP